MKGIQKVAAVAAVALTVGAGSLAFAQDQNQNPQRQGPRAGARAGGPRQGGPELRGVPGVELRGLQLTDAQRQQIREIVQRYQDQQRAEIMLVLTAEQQEKVKQAQAQREARLKQRLDQMQQRRQQRQQQ